nr:MAG TPA: hypothetical protein [Caudoviricetes sp.]
METIKIPLGYEIDAEIEESTDIDSINAPSIFYLEEATCNNKIIILEMEKQIFRVGDRVYDFYYGWGTITAKREDFENTDYIWVVTFENGYIEDYTIEGKYEITDKFRSLSFTEYDFVKGGFSQKRPIDYNDYLGKWGKFWDTAYENTVIIAKLSSYLLRDGCRSFRCYTYGEDSDMGYNNFEPLTEEQTKVLGL